MDLVVGTWNREYNGSWLFEPDPRFGEKSITIEPGLPHTALVNIVKGVLHQLDANISIKMAYQYPEWMAIDDGDGSTPQYITDDHEVEVFVQMRRHVDACVGVCK